MRRYGFVAASRESAGRVANGYCSETPAWRRPNLFSPHVNQAMKRVRDRKRPRVWLFVRRLRRFPNSARIHENSLRPRIVRHRFCAKLRL